MSYEVIMPQLGMTQDTGIIVAWHKAAGDAVAADDVLMEVETDKATMEVPAGRQGFVVEIRAEAGAEVPVGQVIAVIGESSADIETAAATAAIGEAPPPPDPTPVAASTPTTGATSAPQPKAPMPSAPFVSYERLAGSSERILASPKARRLAKEKGIDLGALLRRGAVEPLHAADVERAGAADATATTAASAALARLGISTTRAEFDQILGRTDPAPARGMAFAAFAAAAMRGALGSDTIHIVCRSPGLEPVNLMDPDHYGLSSLADIPVTGPADLTLIDLTETRLTAYAPSGEGRFLTAAADGADRFSFELAFDEADLPLEIAAAMLEDFALRIEDPIRQLF